MNMRQTTRRATNLSIDPDLRDEAKSLGINVSRAAELGIREAVREKKAAAWLRENAEAIAGWNAWVEENGPPLARHRQF
jgi:antitoxin CcdA